MPRQNTEWRGKIRCLVCSSYYLLYYLIFRKVTAHQCFWFSWVLSGHRWEPWLRPAETGAVCWMRKSGNKSRFNLFVTLVYHIRWRYRGHFQLGAVFATRKIFTAPLPWGLLKPLLPCPKEVERMGGYGYMDSGFGIRVKYQTFHRPECFFSFFFKYSLSIYKKNFVVSILLPLKLNFSSLGYLEASVCQSLDLNFSEKKKIWVVFVFSKWGPRIQAAKDKHNIFIYLFRDNVGT